MNPENGYFPNLSNVQFFKSFGSVDPENKAAVSLHFREAFNFRKTKFAKNLTPAFCGLAKKTLPALLKKSLKSKDAQAILCGDKSEIKLYKNAELNTPYLLREPNASEALGVIRLNKLQKSEAGGKIYSLKDFIPFKSKLSTLNKSILCKFNDEKMEMFSLVYKNAEEWYEEDTQGDFMVADEIRKAINWANPRGIGLDIEHEKDKIVTRDQAEVIESYQARVGWTEDGMEIRKGDWVAKTKFYDKKVWEFTKENIETYSMEGDGEKHPAQLPEAA